jgi:hypothetical protein
MRLFPSPKNRIMRGTGVLCSRPGGELNQGAWINYRPYLGYQVSTSGVQNRLYHRNSKLLGLGRQFGKINFGAYLGYLRPINQTHFGIVSPLSIFKFINHSTKN